MATMNWFSHLLAKASKITLLNEKNRRVDVVLVLAQQVGQTSVGHASIAFAANPSRTLALERCAQSTREQSGV
jgi:hypothetical protein